MPGQGDKQMVRDALDRFADGDRAGIAAGGPVFADAVEEAAAPFAAFTVTTGQFVVRGDTVVVEVRLTGTARDGSGSLKARHAQVWEFQDGAVLRAQVYPTIEAAITRAGLGAGPAPPPRPGRLGELERFGRFEAAGDLHAELDLPAGAVRVSVVNAPSAEGLDAALTGPAGAVTLQPVPDQATSNDSAVWTHAIAAGEVASPGPHRLRVRGLDQPRTIVVGRLPELRAPSLWNLFRRRR